MFPRKILVCVGSTREFEIYKAELGWLARHLKSGLVLFHSEPITWNSEFKAEDPVKSGEEKLLGLIDDSALQGIEVEVLVRETPFSLVESIIEVAKDKGCEMVLVPTHARRGIDWLLRGSVADSVLRACKTPMLSFDLGGVPQDRSRLAFDRMIVPTDFSVPSEQALRFALSLQDRIPAPITLFHAIDDFYTTSYPLAGLPSLDTYLPTLKERVRHELEAIVKRQRPSLKTPIDIELSFGRLTEELAELVRRFENPLVVMASAGRDSLGDFVLGSRAERIVRTAHCSVLTLPQFFLKGGEEKNGRQVAEGGEGALGLQII